MAFTEEERKKIEEEEKLRIKLRLKYEQKSSGLAGVLSSICPGLGQIYNGQFGKASLIMFLILLFLVVFSLGITFMVKGLPQKGEKVGLIEEEKPVEITEEGIVIEETKKEEKKDEVKEKAKSPYILTIIGLVGLCNTWKYNVNDAIRTAKKINE
ncbi:MAG: hypothetical protein NZ891_00285, partial [bacterium]|nr:hypothetical protein [bacterium]MDW8163170.1 hypothetical protein [Candidatus Omnitrophota bacterium]